MEYRWFVLRSEPNREITAVAGLLGHGIKAYFPQIRIHQKPRRGVARAVLRPMFCGYFFAHTSPTDPLWPRLYNTPGLRGVLRLGDILASVTVEQLEAIRMKEAELLDQKPTEKPKLKKGDVVRLADGPFTGQLASIDSLDDDERIVILMQLFGRTTRTRVTQNQIELV